MANVEARLRELGVELVPLPTPNHPILRTRRVENMVYVSGHGSKIKGKLGADLTVQDGYRAAREAAIACLGALEQELGDLDKIDCFVKLLGMVNAAPDFTDHPAVLNGASELLLKAFGEDRGAHARSAVGMSSLPNGIAVEIEMIVHVK